MDTTALRGTDVAMKPYRFKPTQLIAPCLLIGNGLIGLESDGLKFQNKEMRDELQEDNPEKFKIDDVTQYLPMVSAYGLQLCGLAGRHDYVDKTIILGTSYLIMGASVLSLKNTTRIEKPDCSTRNSFPSGHTATAFMGRSFCAASIGMSTRGLGLWAMLARRSRGFSGRITTGTGSPTSLRARALAYLA